MRDSAPPWPSCSPCDGFEHGNLVEFKFLLRWPKFQMHQRRNGGGSHSKSMCNNKNRASFRFSSLSIHSLVNLHDTDQGWLISRLVICNRNLQSGGASC